MQNIPLPGSRGESPPVSTNVITSFPRTMTTDTMAPSNPAIAQRLIATGRRRKEPAYEGYDLFTYEPSRGGVASSSTPAGNTSYRTGSPPRGVVMKRGATISPERRPGGADQLQVQFTMEVGGITYNVSNQQQLFQHAATGGDGAALSYLSQQFENMKVGPQHTASSGAPSSPSFARKRARQEDRDRDAILTARGGLLPGQIRHRNPSPGTHEGFHEPEEDDAMDYMTRSYATHM